jgi:hypothetical protein
MINKEPQNIPDTFKSVSESYTVTNCRNGFVIEINGHDDQDNYKTERFIFNTMAQLQSAVQDISFMRRS